MEDMQDMQEVSAQSGEESGKKKSGFSSGCSAD